MNKVLVTARKVKGYSEQELAEILEIPVEQYKQLELSQLRVTPEQSAILSIQFSIPPHYFIDNRRLDIASRIGYLKGEIALLKERKPSEFPANGSVFLATTTLELLKAKDELLDFMNQHLELLEDHEEMLKLFEFLKDEAKKLSNPSKSR